MTQGQGTPPGWYDDGTGTQRWFDGTQWTDHVNTPQPAAAPQQAYPAAPVATAPIPQQVIIQQKKGGFFRSCLGVIVGAVVLLILLCILIAVAVGGGGSDGGTAGTNGGVSQGLGSKDASADVGPVTLAPPDAIGIVYAKTTVTNNSSKRSDYVIDITVTSADGSTQIGTTSILVTNLEPGQKTEGEGPMAEQIPAGAVAKVTSVQRNASI